MFLRNYYTTLRKNYAKITQIIYAQHANIMQISLRRHYANIFVYAIILHRHYAEITQNKLRNHYANYAIITQIHYADITQIHYANHYADYAIITQVHYANNITQFPKISLRRLRKYLFHYASLRNGQLPDAAETPSRIRMWSKAFSFEAQSSWDWLGRHDSIEYTRC